MNHPAENRTPRTFYAAGTSGPAAFRFERLARPGVYRVMDQVDYVGDDGHWYRFPKDVDHNETDFASIPFFLTWMVPKDGSHTPAAVLHDALIGGRKDVHYETSVDATVSDRHADYLFREAMQGSGVSWLRRWLMWAAVTLRTLAVKVDKNSAAGGERERVRWWRVVMLGTAVLVWAILSAAMALDVPDLLAADRDLGWLGDRPWYTEIQVALGTIALGTAAMTIVFAFALGAGRDRDAVERGAIAGFFGGVVVGFLGLPMLATVVGVVGYVTLDRFATFLGRR